MNKESSSMKKIILYGIANRTLRMQVQSYLDDDYEIIGISDSKLTEDYLQGELYITPDEIINKQFDYILVLTTNERSQKEIIDILRMKGISINKIIVPRLLCQKDSEYIPDLKRDLEKEIVRNTNAEGFCLGLSYSLRGLNFNKLQIDCIDCSWHGLDLYYCYKSRQMFDERYKTAILVFPYYYFNYDMSLSEYQFNTGQILACRGFQDWHNADKSHNSVIDDYLISTELFGKKFWMNKRWRKEIPREEKIIENTATGIATIWKKKHQGTLEENILIFERLIQSCVGMRIVMIVPPIFWEVIRRDDVQYILEQKSYFYKIINRYKNVIELFDCSNLMQKREYYYDYEHLNEEGREVLTRLLNQKLFGYDY